MLHIISYYVNIKSSDSLLTELDSVVDCRNFPLNDSVSIVWERVQISEVQKSVEKKILVWHHYYQDDTNFFFLSGTTQKKRAENIFLSLSVHLYTVKQLNPAKEINQICPYNRFRYRCSVVAISITCPGYKRRLMISGPADDCCHTPDVIFCAFVVPTAN